MASADRESGSLNRDVVFTGRDGATRSRHDVVTRTEGGHSATSSITHKDGSVVTREAEVSREPEAGTWEKDVTWTDAEGRSRTRHVVRTRTVEPAAQP